MHSGGSFRTESDLRVGGRTDKADVKSEDLLLNITCGTKRETKILRVVENLVENGLAKFAGIAGKKDDFEKFNEQFRKRLKLGNHEDSSYRTMFAELLKFCAPKSGVIRGSALSARRKDRMLCVL